MRKGLLRSLDGIQPLRNGTQELFDLEGLSGNRRRIQCGSIADQAHGTQQQGLTRSTASGVPTQTLHLEECINLGTCLGRILLSTLPKEPHQIARLLVIHEFIGTWMARKALLGLLLGLPSQRNHPRHPVQSP